MLDYIVIGSGPAGLLVNGEMFKAGLKGICIEKGNAIKSSIDDIYTPYQIFNGYKKAGFNILFGKPLLMLSEGECLGGGSTINSSLHHRTPKYIWNSWITKYGLEDFNYSHAEELYSEIEKKFSCSTGQSKMPYFYKCASKYMQVKQIPRWGYQDDYKKFKRKTAVDVVKEYYKNSLKKVYTGMEVKSIIKIKDNSYEVICLENRQIFSKNKIHRFKSKNVFICAGAGSTPVLLSKVGYRHKKLGLFKVHPTARISLYSSINKSSNEIVDPFQITEFFPELMIGSSANRCYLSEINYPFKKNNKDFSRCLNLYAMAPSNQTGKMVLKGPLKGQKFYFLSKDARYRINFGLNKIIDLANLANYSNVFSPAGEIDLLRLSEKSKKKFINLTIKKTLSSVHIFSSAASGSNKEYCPISSNGSVPGYKGLFVMDSSIIPSCPTVNPQATVTVFALKMIRDFLRS